MINYFETWALLMLRDDVNYNFRLKFISSIFFVEMLLFTFFIKFNSDYYVLDLDLSVKSETDEL